MQVSISELRSRMTLALKKQGHTDENIPFIINMYLGGELRGHTSHGLSSFAAFAKEQVTDTTAPEVVKDTHALFVIDAKSNSGNIVGKRAADEAIKRAKQEGIGIAIVKSMDSWLRPGAVAEYIGDQGFVAIVMNNGRGVAVAPPGGYDPVAGTNPIAYAIPTNDGTLVVDMATAKQAWGQVRVANKNGTDLPDNTFYDDKGNVTVDPKQAWSVMPFGDYKGFSLTFLIEVLCGSLIGMPMMVKSTAKNTFGGQHPDTSGIMLVIDPSQTSDNQTFLSANSEFIDNIKATNAIQGETIRIPGERAKQEQSTKIANDAIDIPDSLWAEIVAL